MHTRTRAESFAAVTTAVSAHTAKKRTLRRALRVCPPAAQDARPRPVDPKLIRTLSSIGGVSYRTLSKQLAWLREHPEVHMHDQNAGRLEGSGDNRELAPLPHFPCHGNALSSSGASTRHQSSANLQRVGVTSRVPWRHRA